MKTRALNPIKRITFWFVLILLAWLLIELGVGLVYFVVRRKPFPRQAYQENMQNIHLGAIDGSDDNRQEEQTFQPFEDKVAVIHPYLGYFANFSGSEQAKYPFLGYPQELLTTSDDRINIAVFGGSFARQLYDTQMGFFSQQVRDITGLEPNIVHFSYGGYKQPQQVLALTYLLSLGAEFDVIINIDGFNEVALGPAENVPKDVFVLYPRQWYFLATQVDSPEVLTRLARIEVIRSNKMAWAGIFDRLPFRSSNIALLIWKTRDLSLDKERADILLALQELETNADHNYQVTGPQIKFDNEKDQYEYMVGAWEMSSLEMHRISQANGMSYFHFLQPNQYVEGSKPIGPEETEIAINQMHPYRRPVILGYPLLRESGLSLLEEGVNFIDLTDIFIDNDAILYADHCCHLNPAGYHLVVEEIISTIFSQ